MIEKVAVMGKHASLVGIMTEAATSVGHGLLPAILIVNAGLLHRVGPNRLHVTMARQIASLGFNVLRFDFSGHGDSSTRTDAIPFKYACRIEIEEAMDYMEHSCSADTFILIGICSGADISVKELRSNDRVVGAVGINGSYLFGDVSGEVSARLEHSVRSRYYRACMTNYKSWLRLVTGKSGILNIVHFVLARIKRAVVLRSMPPVACVSGETSVLTKYDGDILLIYSEGSTALDAFELLHKKYTNNLIASGRMDIAVVNGSDHVFTALNGQKRLIELVSEWLVGGQRSW